MHFNDLIGVDSSDEEADDEVIFNGATRAKGKKFQPISWASQHRLVAKFGLTPKAIAGRPMYDSIGKTCRFRPSIIETIKGDGNCLFRALSFVVCGHQDNHDHFRQVLCNYIEQNDHMLHPFLEEGDGRAYIQRNDMRNSSKGTLAWGTDVEIQAIAKMCDVDVITYIRGTWLSYSARGKRDPTQEGIFLSNPKNDHYNVVLAP